MRLDQLAAQIPQTPASRQHRLGQFGLGWAWKLADADLTREQIDRQAEQLGRQPPVARAVLMAEHATAAE